MPDNNTAGRFMSSVLSRCQQPMYLFVHLDLRSSIFEGSPQPGPRGLFRRPKSGYFLTG